MCNTRAEMDLLIQKMKKLTTDVEAKIAQQAKCEDVMTNSWTPKDMFDKLEEYRFHAAYIEEKMKSLKETDIVSVQEAMDYLILTVELEKTKERISDHEKIIQWLYTLPVKTFVA